MFEAHTAPIAYWSRRSCTASSVAAIANPCSPLHAGVRYSRLLSKRVAYRELLSSVPYHWSAVASTAIIALNIGEYWRPAVSRPHLPSRPTQACPFQNAGLA